MSEQHAVVVRASMAGLLTARVLADRVGHVTVVDRDDLPDGPDPRKGVPQARHAHGLLPSGEVVIRQLFPGLLDELVAGGAQVVGTSTGRWWQSGGYRIAAPDAGCDLLLPCLPRGFGASPGCRRSRTSTS